MPPAPEPLPYDAIMCSKDDILPGSFADELWREGHERLAQVVEAVMQVEKPQWLLLSAGQQAELEAESPDYWRRVQHWLWWPGHSRARLVDAPVAGSEADTITVSFTPGVPSLPDRLRPVFSALLIVADRGGRLKPEFQREYGHQIALEPGTLVPVWWPHVTRAGRPMTAIQRVVDFRGVLTAETLLIALGWLDLATLEEMLAEQDPGAMRIQDEILRALVRLRERAAHWPA